MSNHHKILNWLNSMDATQVVLTEDSYKGARPDEVARDDGIDVHDIACDNESLTSSKMRARIDDGEDYDDASFPSHVTSSRSRTTAHQSTAERIVRAKLHPTGFRQAKLEFDPLPLSLQALCRDLKRICIYDEDGILPIRLKEEFAHLELPDHFFCDDDTDAVGRRYPSHSHVKEILKKANTCDCLAKQESVWNADVHLPVLKWAMEDDSNSDVSIVVEYCISALILQEYRPMAMQSKKVDFCLAIAPKQRGEQDMIYALLSQRPGNSINHTAILPEHPIALSIETKRHGENHDQALLQVATWHSAQWRSLHWGRQEGTSHLSKIEFLAGLIVQGHDWQFVPSILGEDAVSMVVRPPLLIGDTRSEVGILKLFKSLQKLKQYAEGVYWPTFKADILGVPV